MKLISIPKDKYDDYRLDVIFNGYKWDPQFMDSSTIAEHVLVITEEEHEELEKLTEKLAGETMQAEEIINKNQKLAKPLSLPRKIQKELKRMGNYQANRHIRLMRFDFHPTREGQWVLSEVNSDVPGGFAEASIMPKIAANLFERERYRFKNFGEILASAIVGKVKSGRKIMLVHCTSYSDDRQVMQFLGDKLQDIGYTAIYAAADHLRFENNKAISLLDGNTGKIDAIIRFTPLEWLVKMKGEAIWSGYFDTTTVSCNHPIAVYTQTKRFPLVWDLLEKHGADLSAWREHLPETLEVRAARNKEGFIYKPVYGRTGENISIKEACIDDEYEKIIKDVKRNPKSYIAQKRFNSKPVQSENGEEYHVCLGSFVVDGKAAGYYARASKTPRIDSSAADIPVLIEKNMKSSNHIETTRAATGSVKQPVKNLYREAYMTWASGNSIWSKWVRPVPFIVRSYTNQTQNMPYATQGIPYLESLMPDTAIILDLPSCIGIIEGADLARIGWRPIPLYNGTTEQPGAIALVDNTGINTALLHFADLLEENEIIEDAPPVFLLDSNRMFCNKANISVFDNSWDVYEQDMPSPKFFLNNGINKIILCGHKIHRDIHKILYKYQTKGMTILYTNGVDPPTKVVIKKPLELRRLAFLIDAISMVH